MQTYSFFNLLTSFFLAKLGHCMKIWGGKKSEIGKVFFYTYISKSEIPGLLKNTRKSMMSFLYKITANCFDNSLSCNSLWCKYFEFINLKKFYRTLKTYVPLSPSMLSKSKKKWNFWNEREFNIQIKTELYQLTCSYTLYQGHRKQAFPIHLCSVNHSPNLCLSTWNQIYQNQMEA